MNGWIKLPRSIINHWLWQDAEFLKRTNSLETTMTKELEIFTEQE